jgi:hypothetical protein
MAKKNLNKEEVTEYSRYLGGWLKLLGIAKIIQGAFLVMTIFGAIFGAIIIWEGLLLCRAANGAREVFAENQEFLGKEFLHPLKIYFIIQGVIVILVFVLGISSLLALASLIGTGTLAGFIEMLRNF